jgi:hypothetical protein
MSCSIGWLLLVDRFGRATEEGRGKRIVGGVLVVGMIERLSLLWGGNLRFDELEGSGAEGCGKW